MIVVGGAVPHPHLVARQLSTTSPFPPRITHIAQTIPSLFCLLSPDNDPLRYAAICQRHLLLGGSIGGLLGRRSLMRGNENQLVWPQVGRPGSKDAYNIQMYLSTSRSNN
jgi:hypothetical protein